MSIPFQLLCLRGIYTEKTLLWASFDPASLRLSGVVSTGSQDVASTPAMAYRHGVYMGK